MIGAGGRCSAFACLLWTVTICTVWAIWLVAPGAARANDEFGLVTLELRAEEGGGTPTHLCVVARTKGPRTQLTLPEVLAPRSDEAGSNGTWLVDPKMWGGEADAVDRYRCTEGAAGDCRPRVELPAGLDPSELHVACTADELLKTERRGEVRPLFVLLEHLEGSPPSIESIRLDGGVATVGVAADLSQVVVTARSLGGYYQPDRASALAESERGESGSPQRKHATLDLQSRCRLVEVTLPGTRLTKRDRERLSVSVHGVDFDVERCVVGELEDTTVVQIRVPPAPLGVGSIEVELAATEAGKAAAKYGAGYHRAWPVTPFPLTFKQVTFSWRRPKCIYPENSCPTAVLETGTTCDATVTEEGCAYVCPGQAGEDALDLELPLSVEFEKENPTQKWSDKLAQNGQLLTSYVQSDDTYVAADISRWQTEQPANRITGIEVFTEDGGTVQRGVAGVKRLQLKVPGASCEPIHFRPVGDRSYRDDIATIADGEIEFGNPERMARLLSVSMMVAVGGGPAWSTALLDDPDGNRDGPPIFFNGLGMFALQYRPRAPGWSRIGFEGRVGLTLGRWGSEEATPTAQDPDDTSNIEEEAVTGEQRRFAQARVLFEPGVVIAAHDRFGIGAGFGMGASFPIGETDNLTRDRIRFIWSPSLDGRFYVKRWLGLVLQVRAVFGERAFGIPEGTMGNIEDPESRPFKARSLLALFGTVFRF